MDFVEMLDNHKALGADISIATIPVGDRDAPEFGILKVAETGWSSSFIEKTKKRIITGMGKWYRSSLWKQKGKKINFSLYGHLYF